MPTRKRLTDTVLKSLRGTGKRYEVQDQSRAGFFVRVAPAGGKSFWMRYQLNGKRRKFCLGQYPATPLAVAYSRHQAAADQLAEGTDPARQRAKAEGFTVRELAEEFRDRHLKPNVKTWTETWRILDKDVLPQWGDEHADQITPRDVVLLLDGIVDRGAGRVANRTRSILVQLFRFGVSRGMIEASPVVAVERPYKSETTRDRILTEAEIRIFWRKIDDAKLLPMMPWAYRLLLVTGQRRGEIAGAAVKEFDLDAALWTIPGERTKNGRRHQVPLSSLAIECIKALRATLGDYAGPWLLPSPRRATGRHIEPHALTRGISNNRSLFGIPPFTVHDLRRTVRSGLSALGINPITSKKVVNHSLEGMDRVYDQYDYLAEKREALDLWGDHLTATLEGKRQKVQPIRRAHHG